MVRVFAGMLVPMLLGASTAAFAKEDRGIYFDCRKLNKQISHFEGVAEMASDRGDDLWYDSTQQHIRRLEDRRLATCPRYEPPNAMQRFMKASSKWIKRAGKVAKRWFTAGALG